MRIQKIRQRIVDWLLKDLHIRDVSLGENSIRVSPNGNDVLRWTGAAVPIVLGDLGMDTVTGRPQAYVSGSAQGLVVVGDMGGANIFSDVAGVITTTVPTDVLVLGTNGPAADAVLTVLGTEAVGAGDSAFKLTGQGQGNLVSIAELDMVRTGPLAVTEVLFGQVTHTQGDAADDAASYIIGQHVDVNRNGSAAKMIGIAVDGAADISISSIFTDLTFKPLSYDGLKHSVSLQGSTGLAGQNGGDITLTPGAPGAAATGFGAVSIEPVLTAAGTSSPALVFTTYAQDGAHQYGLKASGDVGDGAFSFALKSLGDNKSVMRVFSADPLSLQPHVLAIGDLATDVGHQNALIRVTGNMGAGTGNLSTLVNIGGERDVPLISNDASVTLGIRPSGDVGDAADSYLVGQILELGGPSPAVKIGLAFASDNGGSWDYELATLGDDLHLVTLSPNDAIIYTNSVERVRVASTGETTFAGSVLVKDGSFGDNALAFASAPTSGWYSGNAGGAWRCQVAGALCLSIGESAQLEVNGKCQVIGDIVLAAPSTVSGAVSPALSCTMNDNAAIDAGVEATDYKFDSYRQLLFATGALPLNRTTVCVGPEIAFAAASVCDRAATHAVEAAPFAGVNATITEAYAYWAQSGLSRFDEGVGVGDNTVLQDASAILQINSTTQGVLFPRMTGAQRDAIAAPAEGLVIYNTTTHKLNLRTAAAWEAITSV